MRVLLRVFQFDVMSSGKEVPLPVLVLTSLLLTSSLALTESEWRDASLDFYYKCTKYFLQKDYDDFRKLFLDDGEELVPESPEVGKEGIKQKVGNFPTQPQYFGFKGLLYTSPDVAVTAHVVYGEMLDGTPIKEKGLFLLVLEKGEIRVKMNAFNSD